MATAETFRHDAMATTFSLDLIHAEHSYARQAAQAAFAELDLIDARLSRFSESSDVTRLNRLRAGQGVQVHPDTYGCLQIALRMKELTQGAFDVTYASAHRNSDNPCLDLSPSGLGVRVVSDGVAIDLGGIGKGFALDRLGALLIEWDIRRALLCASTSTVLALAAPPGKRGWPVTFGPAHDVRSLELADSAFSGSGTAAKGQHIIDPGTGRPARGRYRAWATASTGAVADALSTAFMVMSEERIGECCASQRGVRAYGQRTPEGKLIPLAN